MSELDYIPDLVLTARAKGGRILKGEKRVGRPGKPLVTVITAVRNGFPLLEESIRSVLAQTYDSIEYIIIDGASTDGTVDLLREFDDDIDLWISEPDGGVYDAWNKAVSICRGDWLTFLGSDDIFTASAIEEYVSYINHLANFGLNFVSSRVQLLDCQGRLMNNVGEQWHWQLARRTMRVAHCGAFHHRSLFQNYGVFDTSYQIAGDYELLLRIGSSLRAGFLNSVTVKMRDGGLSRRSSRVFVEAFRAKVTTARVPVAVCFFDLCRGFLAAKVSKALRSVKDDHESLWGGI